MLPGIDPDIDQNTLGTLTAATQALSGVGAAANIQALKANGVITAQGTFKQGKDPAEILQNKELMDNVVRTAQEYQEAANKKRNSGNNGTLKERTALAASILSGYQDNANAIIAGGTPRQATIADRRKLALDYIEQQTGVSNTLPALGKGEKAFTLADSIKVDDPAPEENVVVPPPEPATTDPIENVRVNRAERVTAPDSLFDKASNFYDSNLADYNISDEVSKLSDKVLESTDEVLESADEVSTSIFGDISNIHNKNIAASEKRAADALKKDVDSFNNPRKEVLGIYPGMKSSAARSIVTDDFESNFGYFTPNERVLWLRGNKEHMTKTQIQQAEEIIVQDKQRAKGKSLSEIINQ